MKNDDYENAYIQNEKKRDLNGKNPKSQQWDIYYVDETYPDEPKKGEINTEFGLYVDRTFYIVSELNDHRYLSLPDNVNPAIKTRNGRK